MNINYYIYKNKYDNYLKIKIFTSIKKMFLKIV